MESRLVKDDNWSDSLFILRKEGNQELITFPKNLESFADNLFMISLLQIAILKQWTIQLSTKSLDTSVFESAEGPFFAGFVAAACQVKTGAYIHGNTRYSKGVASFQTFSVEKKHGKVAWLRTGGLDNLLARLSGMKGFTKDYWSLRGTIAAIYRMIEPIEVDHLQSYFLPKSEVMKHIKTKLPYNNGGLFRSEEIAYLAGGFQSTETLLSEFLLRLENPSEDFVKNFEAEYAPIKTAIENAERGVRLLAVNRSKLLFPAGTKKGILKFKKLTLEEKLEKLSEDKPQLFEPISLPRLTKQRESQRKEGTPQWRAEVFGTLYTNNLAKDVIDSWYDKFFSSEEDE